MSGVTLKGVVKRYGDIEVIHGVNIEIDHGEFCVFVGPSGCGKSTLLRMVAGLEETTEGIITIGERDITKADAADRGVAMVFQTYALYPHMTVEENMGFGLKMNGVDKQTIQKKVSKASEILKLEPYLKRKPKALSGGQRQRVAIGRAIVRGPEVFLFDEPLSNLDAELRVDMRIEIARLHDEIGATMIYVTHDQVEAMTLADKIVVLRDGFVEQVGSPMALYQAPDNKFVAGFIGSPSMNFVRGIVEGGKVRLPALMDKIIEAPDSVIEKEGGVIVGLRPQNLQIEPAQSSLSVDIAERLGGVSYEHLSTPTGERLVVETRERDTQPLGTEVSVMFEPEAVMFFDEETELRLR